MKILFVCLGNICRSATADEVMRTLLRKEGLDKEVEVDSAGTSSYHRGELPDERMRMHAIVASCPTSVCACTQHAGVIDLPICHVRYVQMISIISISFLVWTTAI